MTVTLETIFTGKVPIPLKGVAKDYDWGGKKAIPELIGVVNADGKPYAEYWIGAHSGAPSTIQVPGAEMNLADLIKKHPLAILGKKVTEEFGSLPYLLKILDAEKMLSIQDHPDEATARLRYELENKRGIPLNAANRNYKDPNPKPEVHVALTDFWMLHGFRPLEEIASELKRNPALKEMTELPSFRSQVGDFSAQLLTTGNDEKKRGALLKKIYSYVMTLDQGEINRVVDRLLRDLPKDETGLDKDAPDFWAVRAARNFPLSGGNRDRGILSIYLLNILHLKPGEGTFQEAGVLHAYLEGTNVELMANSDNVLRGGLTPKHVDVPELLDTVKFSGGKPEIIRGKSRSVSETVFLTPARQFELSRIDVSATSSYGKEKAYSAESLIVLAGQVQIRSPGGSFTFKKGDAFLIPAAMEYSIEGDGTLFKAAVPKP